MQSSGQPGALYRSYILLSLLFVYMISFADRTLIGVLGEPIKAEFGLSDFQIGLLSGPAFAFVYTFLGIPAGLLSERFDRSIIIAIACIIWSSMTLLCGIAATPWQFALARIGVGVGEAGCTPPSHSLISDYFPRNRRGAALSVYSLGIPAGMSMASLLGAYLAVDGAANWRWAFIIAAIIGLVTAPVFALSVRDPRKSRNKGQSAVLPPLQSIAVVLRNRQFLYVSGGGAFASMIGYGSIQFTVPFWTRTHGLSLMDAALLFGVVFCSCAALGTLLSGFIADRLAVRDHRAYGRMATLGFLIAAPCYLLGYNSLSIAPAGFGFWMAPPFIMIGICTHFFYMSPMLTLTQNMFAPELRATAAAILLFFVNMIGYILGPPLIGFLSDIYTIWSLGGSYLLVCDGVELSEACVKAHSGSVRFALSIGTTLYLLAAWCFSRVGSEQRGQY